MNYLALKSGAIVSLLFLAVPAVAQPDWMVYDGTGSIATSSSTADAHLDEDYKFKERGTRKSAAAGEIGDMVALAGILEYGFGTTGLDRAGALDLYEKIADKGNVLGQRKMCVAYLLGEGRPVNLVKGMTYCNALGDKDPEGVFGGAFDFDHGISGPADDNSATALYKQAGQMGSGEAMDALGQKALALGKPDAANEWFREGAILGSADAMDHLAVMRETGQAGAANPAEAFWLYANAARRGNAHAAAWLAAQPPTVVPVPRVSIFGTKGLVTETVTDGGKTYTRPLDNAAAIVKSLTDNYPWPAVKHEIQGGATIHCFIDGSYQIDLCLLENEYPIGFGFGPTLMRAMNRQFNIAQQDADGHPTANTVANYTVHWVT